MTTDNRANEPTAEQVESAMFQLFPITVRYDGYDVPNPGAADKREGFKAGIEYMRGLLSEGAPSGAQVELAARAFYETPLGLTNWDRMVDVEPDLATRYREGMERALTAAGVATQSALDGAPEPEGVWEYRGRLQSCGYVAEGYISAEHAMNGLKVELEDHPYLQMDDTAIVERARVREWLPVEGENK